MICFSLQTVFEIGLGSHSEMYNVMKIKRHRHSEKINKHRHLVNYEVAETNGKPIGYRRSNHISIHLYISIIVEYINSI